MAEVDTSPILQNILKAQQKNGVTMLKGFSLLNKNIVNSTKVNMAVGKGLMTGLAGLAKNLGNLGNAMGAGFQGLLEAEKTALQYEKQQDTGDKLAKGEAEREGGKESLIGKLPKAKDLIDPKKWGDFAKGFVGSLFGMLSSLVTTILVPLAVGAMKGYYGTIA